jgi:hypothetical protein
MLQALYPRGKSLLYALAKRLDGPRAGLVAIDKRKIACLRRETIPSRPSRSPWLYGSSYPDLQDCLICLDIRVSSLSIVKFETFKSIQCMVAL